MRIGIDGRLWSQSGVGRYTRNLVKELQLLPQAHDFFLFIREEDKKNVDAFVKKKNWHVITCSIRWHTLKEQVSFPHILKKYHLDLVHFPYFSVPIFYSGAFIVTIHDLILHHFPTGQATTLPLPVYRLKHRAYKFILGKAAARAKHIIAVSEATKQEIIDHLYIPPEKITVTYEGVDKAVFQKNQPLPSILQGSQYFLYVGNAYPHKNLAVLLDAFIALNNPTIKLVFVGKEDYFYKRLKGKFSVKKHHEQIVFLHMISDEQLGTVYQHAIALVMPSVMEGFGLTTLEAMANTCLVIASEIPSLVEVCSDAAIYFDPKDSQSLQKAMQAVLQFPEKKKEKYIQKGLQHIQHFSWKSMAERTLALYEKTIV